MNAINTRHQLLAGNWIAFLGQQSLACASPQEVVQALIQHGEGAQMALVFDAITSAPIELDLRGDLAQVLARLPTPSVQPIADQDAPPANSEGRGVGRPKLGVVAREVTLLPRHWDWLATQSGGASVVLRKLVEDARRSSKAKDWQRQRIESAYRFISAIAGNERDFEEVSRALFAYDLGKLSQLLVFWPSDIAQHVMNLLQVSAENIAE